MTVNDDGFEYGYTRLESKYETIYKDESPIVEDFGLGDLISYLESKDPNKTLPIGFHNPHSYRGFYEQLAFEPTKNIKVQDMLEQARLSLGATFEGYKGGGFKMNEHSEVWIAYIGSGGGEKIGKLLMDGLFK